jgi:pantetheine-phosphate adenylyltransferase
MKTIVPASLDPITLGHIDIIERALKVFDHVVVGVGINPKKKYTFTMDERVDMAKKALIHLGNKVDIFPFHGLLVDFAYTQRIDTIVRGVRNSIIDFDFETFLNQVNQNLREGIDTHILFANSKLSHVSSSVAKDLTVNYSADLLDYVPMYVKMQLEKKLLNQLRIGVTGDIGAGKSFVTSKIRQFLSENNIKSYDIDMDLIGRYILTESDEPIAEHTRARVSKLLGTQIINSETKKVDLKSMGKILWPSPDLIKQFNEIMFKPMLLEYTKRLRDKEGVIFINSALFAEANMMGLCNNNVIVVKSVDDVRISRLSERGYSDNEIKDRMKAQYNSTEKIRIINAAIKSQNYGTLITYENSYRESYTIVDFFKETIFPFILGNLK